MSALFPVTNSIQLPPLRAWQERIIPQIRAEVMRGRKRIPILSATGSGKTLLAAKLFEGSILKGKKPIFTVPDVSLVNQSLHSFERVGIRDVGVIQAMHHRTDAYAQVQIASIHTLVRREIPDVDLVIVDEFHLRVKAFEALMNGPAWENKVIIGLSATPWSKGLGLVWGKDYIKGLDIAQGIAEGVLCPYRAFAPEASVNRSALKVERGEYTDESVGIEMSKREIVAGVVETWREVWGKGNVFMFCRNRAHAQAQRDEFLKAGIPFGYIDGTMSADERDAVFREYRAGRILGIASVNCLSRGVDEDVRYIIDCAPTKSRMKLVQQDGRGLRTKDGKEELVIADHAGNLLELGALEDIGMDELDCREPNDKSESKERQPNPPQTCPKCRAIVPSGAHQCPYCKATFERKLRDTTEHVAGKLVEIKPGKKAPKDEKQEFYSSLLGIAHERRYQEGWCAHKYREFFGVWPRQLDKRPATPTRKVREWLHDYETKRKQA